MGWQNGAAAAGGYGQGAGGAVGQEMREATIDDYRWLYAHGYMSDGLKCARAIMLDIVDRCPGTFLDYGCGRGDLVRWINEKTRGHAIGWDPAGIEPFPTCSPDWIISCDVLEHIPRADIYSALRELCNGAHKGLILTIANMSDVHSVNGEEVQLHLIQEPALWWTGAINQCQPGCKFTHRAICKDRFAIVVDFV